MCGSQDDVCFDQRPAAIVLEFFFAVRHFYFLEYGHHRWKLTELSFAVDAVVDSKTHAVFIPRTAFLLVRIIIRCWAWRKNGISISIVGSNELVRIFNIDEYVVLVMLSLGELPSGTIAGLRVNFPI